MAYADHSDMAARFDARTVGQLLSDNGTAVTDLSNSTVLATLLSEASGTIEAAAQVGGRYSKTDLEALAASSPATNGSQYLAGLVCRIAMLRLIQRRPEKYASVGKQLTEEVEPVLDQLRAGSVVFDIESNVAAGDLELSSIDGAALRENNVLPTRTRRFYPNRSGSLPLGSQN